MVNSEVEREWFREVVGGEDLSHLPDRNDPQRYWRIEPDDTAESIISGYREEIARPDALILPDDVDLDALVTEVHPRDQGMPIR
jgi:hypothetical protein